MKKKLKDSVLYSISLTAIILFFCYLGNNWIQISTYDLSFRNLPSDFNNFKILHISDLHNKEFGKQNKSLIQKIQGINPDIIVITGDLIDYKKSDINIALDFVDNLSSIAPIYFVNGNHEWWSEKSDILNTGLDALNIITLNNKKIVVSKGDSEISLIGIDDPAGFSSKQEYFSELNKLKSKNFSLLLSHRAENFGLYVNNYDLVFSGHTHGGQIRIPFIGGLVAPNQGFFPKYTSGLFVQNETKMIVSRGLGNSIIPIRIFNRPELVVVELSSEESTK